MNFKVIQYSVVILVSINAGSWYLDFIQYGVQSVLFLPQIVILERLQYV